MGRGETTLFETRTGNLLTMHFVPIAFGPLSSQLPSAFFQPVPAFPMSCDRRNTFAPSGCDLRSSYESPKAYDLEVAQLLQQNSKRSSTSGTTRGANLIASNTVPMGLRSIAGTTCQLQTVQHEEKRTASDSETAPLRTDLLE